MCVRAVRYVVVSVKSNIFLEIVQWELSVFAKARIKVYSYTLILAFGHPNLCVYMCTHQGALMDLI